VTLRPSAPRKAGGPKVFLTGASSGIGEALAHRYAAQGATLGLFARRQSELERVASTLVPATVATYAGDVRDPLALAAAGADFVERFGTPDIVIGNAGVSRGTLTAEVADLPDFRAVFETNVLGLVHTFQPFLAAMRNERRGVLAGVASVAGFRGLPGSGAYSASKAAAIAYLESLRVELVGSGIRVVTICPGFVATPMTARNPYAMPFLLAPDKAARLIHAAIARRQRFYVLPWQMAWVGRVLTVMPRPLFDSTFARARRKPRRGE
jgi:NAD(P)-dependent dehydrogenase (short-subunit alcohol dehydrogenase family)